MCPLYDPIATLRVILYRWSSAVTSRASGGPGSCPAILGYEHDVSEIFDAHLRGLCMYDRREFPPALMNRVLSAHEFEIAVQPAAITARHWAMRITDRGGPAGIQLCGEVDCASGHYLTARLAEHAVGDGDVVVDASA
jgi:hypothetical protein